VAFLEGIEQIFNCDPFNTLVVQVFDPFLKGELSKRLLMAGQPPKVVCPHWMIEPQPPELQGVLLEFVSDPYCGVGLILSCNDSPLAPPLVANSRWCCLRFR
jgi:hypothetical protein